jgi:microcystin-dependent protein
MESFIAQIMMFAGNFAPRGWALCNGQILSIAQNTALFSLLGTTYGGNGQTTFALPNLQGRVPVHPGQLAGGSNYQLGETSGTESVTLTNSQMPAHTHPTTVTIQSASSSQAPSTEPAGAVLVGGTTYAVFAPAPDGTAMNPGMATATVALTGGNQPVGILQPFLCINFCICMEGIFPSRN